MYYMLLMHWSLVGANIYSDWSTRKLSKNSNNTIDPRWEFNKLEIKGGGLLNLDTEYILRKLKSTLWEVTR